VPEEKPVLLPPLPPVPPAPPVAVAALVVSELPLAVAVAGLPSPPVVPAVGGLPLDPLVPGMPLLPVWLSVDARTSAGWKASASAINTRKATEPPSADRFHRRILDLIILAHLRRRVESGLNGITGIARLTRRRLDLAAP
jgi:hypothetical protein